MSNNHKIYPHLTNFVISLGLIGYTLWFYRGSLNLGFNSDAFYLISPVHLSGLWGSLAWDGTYHYAPITISWLWVQHFFLGLNETGYQVINVVQQGFIAILVFDLAKELTNKRTLALLAALLFVSSANYYEIIYWSIVGSYYHVSTFFYLIGLIAFIRFLKNGPKWLYWLFTACVGLSLFSHELTLSLLPVSVVYYLFVHLSTDDRQQFWQPWLNRQVWLNLGRLLIGPMTMVGFFLVVKAVMSLYSDVTGQGHTLSSAIYWFTRGLFAAITFRGDDRFVTGQLVNFFGGPEHAWVWPALITPPILLLFVVWFNRLERFLLLWLVGQLLMTQLAIGISPRHLYIPTMAAAILIVEMGNRLLTQLVSLFDKRALQLKTFNLVALYSLIIFLFIIPASRDLKQAEQLWQKVSGANQSLKQIIMEALQTGQPARELYIINATRYLYRDGFAAWTFQNGLSNSIMLNFPGQFSQIHQLYFFLDTQNVANGSRRGNLDEMDFSILDKEDYLFVLYLPEEYKFIHVTRSYLAKKGLDKVGIQSLPSVYNPESAPALAWQKGAWPWLNLSPGQTLTLSLKNPAKNQPWLAVYNLFQEGRDLEVEINSKVIGTLKAPSNQQSTWLNETLPLPANQPKTIELTLRGVGTIPANFAQIGLFDPQQVYHVENSRALWWNNNEVLSIAPKTSLTLPFQECVLANCKFSITYLSEPGREFSIVKDDKPLKLNQLPAVVSDWITATVTLPVPESPIFIIQATGTLPVLIKEISLH